MNTSNMRRWGVMVKTLLLGLVGLILGCFALLGLLYMVFPHPSDKPTPLFTEWTMMDYGWRTPVNVTQDKAGNLLVLDRARNTVLIILSNGSGNRGEWIEPTLENAYIKLDDGREWHVAALENALLVARESGQIKKHQLPLGFTKRIGKDVNPYGPILPDHIAMLIACCKPEEIDMRAMLSGLQTRSSQPSSSPARYVMRRAALQP